MTTCSTHNGVKRWYKYDELHRIDGPAVTFPDGTQEWYFYGDLHRNKFKNGEDGPAIVYPDGTQEWYLQGERHRTDGPATL